MFLFSIVLLLLPVTSCSNEWNRRHLSRTSTFFISDLARNCFEVSELAWRNRVCLHPLFLYVICVMSVFKAIQGLCCMLLHVPTLNNIQQNKTFWPFFFYVDCALTLLSNDFLFILRGFVANLNDGIFMIIYEIWNKMQTIN